MYVTGEYSNPDSISHRDGEDGGLGGKVGRVGGVGAGRLAGDWRVGIRSACKNLSSQTLSSPCES